MGRKRKTPRGMDPLGVIPFHYTKQQFEERNKAIIDFSEAIRSRNRLMIQRELSKEDVAQQFTLAVLEQYATTETQCFELLGQLDSPAYNTYWAKLAGNKSVPQSEQPKDRNGLKITKRKLPPALVKKYPHCVALEHKQLGLIIIPDISLRGINQISFKTVVKSLLHANSEIDSLHLYVRQAWTAIVRLVYHFEDSASQERKLREMDVSDSEVDDLLEHYRLSHQSQPCHDTLLTTKRSDVQSGSKRDAAMRDKQEENDEQDRERDPDGGKRDDEEEAYTYKEGDKEDTDTGQKSRSKKRLKRGKVELGGWQELETELDLAGEVMPARPVSLQFADRDLAFRPKS